MELDVTMINRILVERDQKFDIVDHINQDHMEELLAIVEGHDENVNVTSVAVADFFHNVQST